MIEKIEMIKEMKCSKIEREIFRRLNIILENQRQLAKAIINKKEARIVTIKDECKKTWQKI